MRSVGLGVSWILLGLAAAGLAATAPAPPTSAAPRAPPVQPAALKILSDTVLPQACEWASDVRWAGERSVYLALEKDGVIEWSLDPAGPPPREMIPPGSRMGGSLGAHRIAASSRYLVASAVAFTLTWRSLADPTRAEEAFEAIGAIDLKESRLAIVGARRDSKGTFGADGAIAWIGSLDNKLADLKPILYDVAGPGVPTLNRCATAPLEAARFLPDGSLIVVPGFQSGINLYDDQGRLLKTWDTGALGIDTDCASLSVEQGYRLAGHAAERHAWLNQRRTVDSVLPLPQGPGLVVRKVAQGRTRWELKILRRDGSVQSHAIPIEGNSEFFHLQGDVRPGAIVFLLHEIVFRGGTKDHPAPPRLFVTGLPQEEHARL